MWNYRKGVYMVLLFWLRIALNFFSLYLLVKCFSIQKSAFWNFFGKTNYKISLRLVVLTCKPVFNQMATKQKATLYHILFFVRLSSILECNHLTTQVSGVTLLIHPLLLPTFYLPSSVSRVELLCFMSSYFLVVLFFSWIFIFWIWLPWIMEWLYISNTCRCICLN